VRRVWAFSLLMAGGASLTSCGDSEPLSPDSPSLPPRFRVVGNAAGGVGGRTAECQLNLVVELAHERRRDDQVVEYSGTHGGDVSRTVLESDGSGLSLWADVYNPETVARLTLPDSLELVLFDTVGVQSRFWREIAFLAGARRGGDPGSGTWSCAPFDINEGGYVDTSLTVQGRWQIEPVPGVR
jgi:hypothetical protein